MVGCKRKRRSLTRKVSPFSYNVGLINFEFYYLVFFLLWYQERLFLLVSLESFQQELWLGFLIQKKDKYRY